MRHWFFLSLFCFSVVLSAQHLDQPRVDSARAILCDPEANLLKQATAHIDIATAYIYVTPDTSKVHLDEVFNTPPLLQALEADTAHGHYLQYCYYHLGNYELEQAKPYIQQVIRLTDMKGTKNDRINARLTRCYILTELREPEAPAAVANLIKLTQGVADSAEAMGYTIGKDFLSRHYRHQNRIDTALTILLNLQDSRAYAMAGVYQTGVDRSIALYLRIAGEYDRAVAWYHKALRNTTADHLTRVDAYLKLGQLHAEKTRLDSLRLYLDRLRTEEIITEVHKQEYALLQAHLAQGEGRYADATTHIAYSREVFANPDDYLTRISQHLIAAAAEAELGHPAAAAEEARAGLEVLRQKPGEKRYKDWATLTHYLINGSSRAQGQVKLADLTDSLRQYNSAWREAESREATKEVSVRYETEKIAANNLLLQQEKELATTSARAYQGLGLGVGLLAVGLAGFLYVLRRRNQQLQLAQARISRLNADINHRATNNLKNVIRLLRSQRRSALATGADVSIANALERQILAYTKLQDQLRASLTEVNLSSYLEEFCAGLAEAFRAGGQSVRLQLVIAAVNVHPDFAAPLALIINELATNSAKYGKREGGGLHLRLEVVLEGQDKLRVLYNDGGPAEKPVDAEVHSSGQGMDLIRGFTAEIDGCLVRYGDGDFAYEAVFDLSA